MSNTGNSIKMEAIREIAAGTLTTSFQNLGGVFTRDAFRIWLTNNTNGDAYFSVGSGVNNIKMPAQSGRAYDNKTNDMFFKKGTQWSVKFDTPAPAIPAGWVGLEVEYV